MRIVRIFSILVGAFLSLSFGSAHAGNIREGRYIGQYACGHVLYKATLEVFDGGTGRFSFTGRQNGVSGAYRVTILSMGNNAMMRPAQWESQPPGFSMVGASLLPFGDRLTGRMDDSACTSLQLVFDNSAGNGQTANAPGFATNTGVPGRSQNRPDTNGYTPPQVAAPTANSGFDCISQRAKVIKTYLNSTEGRDTTERANAFVTRPDLNEAYSQASVCAKQVTQDARARLLNAIPDNASAADLAIISPQVARIQADFAASYNDFQTLSSAKALISGWIRGPRDQKERYAAEQARLRALTYPGAPMENVFSTKDAPKLTAFYTSVAKAVSQTNDEAVLSRMARDLLPFYNGEAGMNGASIDIKDQDGYGRTQAMGGYDIYAVTLAHPSAENLMKLIVAQADPLQRPQVIAEYNRRKAMPGPRPASWL